MLTNDQKSSIIISLIIAAKFDDGNMNVNEIQSIAHFANELGLSTTEFDPYLNKLPTLRKQDLMNILHTLSKEQKKWLMNALYSMIHADGKISEKELNFIMGFSKDLGFSEEENMAIAKEYINNKK